MANRYLPTELQDSENNVIYPHSEADVIFMQDGRNVQTVLARLDSLMETINSVTSSGEVTEATALVTAAALAEVRALYTTLSSDLGGFTPVIDASGKITGYKTKAGADTVFPFGDTWHYVGRLNSSFSFSVPELENGSVDNFSMVLDPVGNYSGNGATVAIGPQVTSGNANITAQVSIAWNQSTHTVSGYATVYSTLFASTARYNLPGAIYWHERPLPTA